MSVVKNRRRTSFFIAFLGLNLLGGVANAQAGVPGISGDFLEANPIGRVTDAGLRDTNQTESNREFTYGLIGGFLGGTVTNLAACQLAPSDGRCAFYPLVFGLGFAVGLIGGLAIATADEDGEEGARARDEIRLGQLRAEPVSTTNKPYPFPFGPPLRSHSVLSYAPLSEDQPPDIFWSQDHDVLKPAALH